MTVDELFENFKKELEDIEFVSLPSGETLVDGLDYNIGAQIARVIPHDMKSGEVYNEKEAMLRIFNGILLIVYSTVC